MYIALCIKYVYCVDFVDALCNNYNYFTELINFEFFFLQNERCTDGCVYYNNRYVCMLSQCRCMPGFSFPVECLDQIS